MEINEYQSNLDYPKNINETPVGTYEYQWELMEHIQNPCKSSWLWRRLLGLISPPLGYWRVFICIAWICLYLLASACIWLYLLAFDCICLHLLVFACICFNLCIFSYICLNLLASACICHKLLEFTRICVYLLECSCICFINCLWIVLSILSSDSRSGWKHLQIQGLLTNAGWVGIDIDFFQF